MKIIRLLGLIALFVALAASIRLNVLLYQEASGNYNDLNRVRLDPLGLSAYADAPLPPADGDLRRVVLYGDSRAAEWIMPEVADVTFINRGVGAQTTAQVLGRFDQDVAPLRPHTVIIQAGINDLKTIPLFPEQKESIIQSTKSNVQQMVQRSLEAGAEQVILTTIFPLGEIPLERRLVWSDDVAVAIEEANAYISSLASDQVTVLETGPILSGDDGAVRPQYSRDFLHLNGEGYAALNGALAPILRRQ